MTDEINVLDENKPDKNKPKKKRFIAPKIVYQRGVTDNEKQPEFKPGNTPDLQFGDEMLNNNIPWDKIVIEILTRDHTLAELAEESKSTTSVLIKILKQDFSDLNFRTGARLLGIHCQLFPEKFA